MLFSKLSLCGGLLAAAAVFAQNSTTSVDLATGAACACTQLASTFGDLLLTSNSTNYTAETINYWDVRSDLLPKCIFMPTEADQVAEAVKIVTSCSAQFAMRGGGHMNFPGSNNIDGGVLLAFNSMLQLDIADDNSTIAVGPGNRWVDVYTALSERDLYCVGGRLKVIGVAGLELIGGFHYFNNKYGMSMDNVLGYDVILGNGTQVVADATTNPDLFWALKGGSNNFGIVTKFTIKALPIPEISTTIQNYAEENIPEFIAATVDLANNDSPDIAAGSVISISYNTTTKTSAASLLGVQEGTESPPSRFANFTAIPSTLDITRVQRPVDWHAQLDSPNQMFRVQFAHKTMIADADQLVKIYNGWRAAVEDISDIEGLYPTFVMNILPASAITFGKTNGVGNTWGLDDTHSLILWQFSTGWANAVDDLRITNWARSLLDYWHLENQQAGLATEFLYMGDAGEFQDPFAGFPYENIVKMRAIREAYDPLGTFSKLNWGGFKLGN